jgi:hypothetical protein
MSVQEAGATLRNGSEVQVSVPREKVGEVDMTCYAGLSRARLPDSLVGATRPSCVLYLLAAKDVVAELAECQHAEAPLEIDASGAPQPLSNESLSWFHRNETFSILASSRPVWLLS